jgi:hypothetical protein
MWHLKVVQRRILSSNFVLIPTVTLIYSTKQEDQNNNLNLTETLQSTLNHFIKQCQHSLLGGSLLCEI